MINKKNSGGKGKRSRSANLSIQRDVKEFLGLDYEQCIVEGQ